MNILKNLSSIMLVLLLASGTAMAGEEYSEENVRHEISYLAKKLVPTSEWWSPEPILPRCDPLIGTRKESSKAAARYTT